MTGVWLGNDDSSPTKKTTGGGLPVEIWSRVMQTAHQGVPVAGLPGLGGAPAFVGTAPRPPAAFLRRPRPVGTVGSAAPALAHRSQHGRLVPRSAVRPAVRAGVRVTIGSHLLIISRRDGERAMKLENKVAIVTGAARGIGLAIAKRYVAAGAKVTLADVDAAAGEAAAHELGNAQCRFIATDVSEARQSETMVAETCRAFGGLDILVNNAGIIHAADFLDLAEADFDRVLRVNLKGAFLVGQAAARRMVAASRAASRRAPSSI